MKDSLNEPQRRFVQNLLQSVEQLVERSRELRAMARRGDEDGVLMHWHAHLSEQENAELELLERTTLAQLKLLRDAFEFERVVEDLRHKLYVQFSLLWADLEDVRPEKMVGRGAVDPEAAAVLSPVMQRLIELSQSFVDLLEKEEA